MSLSAAEVERLRNQTNPQPASATLSKEEAALIWSNLKPYQKLTPVIFCVLFFGVLGMVVLFFKQYYWSSKTQQIVRVNIWLKMVLVMFGLLATFVQLAKIGALNSASNGG